ncbi:hypothetical protein HL658_09940 [Azospirillum sp. RWY-5-1]|uniref:Uncharacterized protein n=1 Tax=Azospirillum oleiclasticum TaxID=2735135 RepID=A0ABX2TA06_9PROT|nr:hypothetical protein [Azospirillum oleiclasticum]NYZ12873.1 hypothetical protein [Azospirillum oleiclasticum]NYZ20033.1 hypothetical protein [Azospirillum oleiclasticum]
MGVAAAVSLVFLCAIFTGAVYLMRRPSSDLGDRVLGLVAALMSFTGILVLSLAARAAEAAPAPPLPSLSELAGLALAGVLGLLGLLVRGLVKVAVRHLETRTGLMVDAATRDYLDAALDRAVDLGLAKAAEALGVAAPAAELRAHALHVAAGYAQERVPDALARFGIGTPALADMLAARLATAPALIDRTI